MRFVNGTHIKFHLRVVNLTAKLQKCEHTNKKACLKRQGSKKEKKVKTQEEKAD